MQLGHNVLLPLFYRAGQFVNISFRHFTIMFIRELDMNFFLLMLSLFVLALVFGMLVVKNEWGGKGYFCLSLYSLILKLFLSLARSTMLWQSR